jgi:hypothetical protein
MIKYALVILLLSGCSTIFPVRAKFPEAPQVLLDKCSELIKLDDNAKLSDLAKTVVKNYTNYHVCSAKNDGWVEWYETQKKIYEEVK